MRALAATGVADFFLQDVFANQIITPLQGGLITAGEFAIGGFGAGLVSGYAGGANSTSQALQSALRGAAIGAGMGFAAGYSYTAGLQSFIHGANTWEHNWKAAPRQWKQLIVNIDPVAIQQFTNPPPMAVAGNVSYAPTLEDWKLLGKTALYALPIGGGGVKGVAGGTVINILLDWVDPKPAY